MLTRNAVLQIFLARWTNESGKACSLTGKRQVRNPAGEWVLINQVDLKTLAARARRVKKLIALPARLKFDDG